jgi:hypothetical protein
MKITRTNRIDYNPTNNDLEIASFVYRALTAVRDDGRFGDRKVFISAPWIMMLRLDIETGCNLTNGATIEDFKAWLLRSRRIARDGSEKGAPLVVLVRADLVAAMDHAVVMASETVTDGATFHFVLDPVFAHDAYAPRISVPNPFVPTERGGVGMSR